MPDGSPPPDARTASLFRNGRNQAVRIPKDFELPGDEVKVWREGDTLMIAPVKKKRDLLAVLDWLKTQPRLEEDDRFAEIDDPPADPVDL